MAATLLVASLVALCCGPLSGAALTTAQVDIDSLLAFKAAALDVGPRQSALTAAPVSTSNCCHLPCPELHARRHGCSSCVIHQILVTGVLVSEPVGVYCLQPDDVLYNWVNGTDPCGSGWYGVSCNCSDTQPVITEVRAHVGCAWGNGRCTRAYDHAYVPHFAHSQCDLVAMSRNAALFATGLCTARQQRGCPCSMWR